MRMQKIADHEKELDEVGTFRLRYFAAQGITNEIDKDGSIHLTTLTTTVRKLVEQSQLKDMHS